MLVSIITVNLNNRAGLERTLESVFHQTYKDIEFIIIDGASIDGSTELIERSSDKIALWVSEKDNGIYNAMNKGWKHATGEYCLFLNSGDYLYKTDTIAKTIKYLDGTALVFGDIMREDKNGRKLDFHPEVYSLYVLLHKNLPHQGCFIKTEILKQLGGYDEECKVLADWVLYNRAIIELNAQIKKIPEIVSVFEMGGISTTRNSDDEGLWATRKHFPFMEDVYKTFQKLRYYELSRPHQALEKVLSKLK